MGVQQMNRGGMMMTKKEEQLIKEINKITDKGNNAEVKRNKDGTYNVYDVKKSKVKVG